MSRQPDVKNVKLLDLQHELIELEAYLDHGKDGVVYRGRFKRGPDTAIAVKFCFPVEEGRLWSAPSSRLSYTSDLKGAAQAELQLLKKLSHPNIQRYMSSGVLTYNKSYFEKYNSRIKIGEEIPFIVSRLVTGTRLDQILAQEKTATFNLADCLVGICAGVAYIHEKRILHNDLRSPNIVVEESTEAPVILDLGLSKNFSIEDPSLTRIFFDPNPIPKGICELVMRAKGEQGWERHLLKDLLFPHLDLFHFGLLIKEALDSRLGKSLDAFTSQYLHLVERDLSEWYPVVEEARTEFRGDLRTAKDLLEKLVRLRSGSDHFRQSFARKEAEPSRVIVRQNGIVKLRESIAPFLSHPTLRRLHNLNQLSLVHYVYPSAGQSRFDHVLSVLGRTQEIWRALSRRPAFLFQMDADSVHRLEVLALVHDINHFPFLHYFQEAGVASVDRAQVIETFIGWEDQKRGHSSLKALLEAEGVSAEYLKQVLAGDILTSWTPAEQIICSIVNSGLDADKLAYLPDDAFFSGVSYGRGIDEFGLMEGIDVGQVPLATGRAWHIVFEFEALPAIESLCFARYWNFQRLYWHHTNRAIASMIIWTVRELYGSGNIPEGMEGYLDATRNLGEGGALQYLSSQYSQRFRFDPPILNLASDRSVIYKRVFEKPIQNNDERLTSFQDRESGPKNRQAAQLRVYEAFQRYAKRQLGIDVYPQEVLLDIPLRKMDLGGEIFIRTPDGTVERARSRSLVLKDLEENFGLMSKTLRVFVSPRIRNQFVAQLNRDRDQLEEIFSQTLFENLQKSEVV